jgi:alkanesulfonate monooxygenase SsuD/methylene tetrahydromethanopterin reductase-like flavin-dependent oxidoreductase (luciferase family)
MGLEAEASRIQDLFLAGKKDEAVMAVPSEFADEISLVGSRDRIKDRLQVWRETPVTSLLISTRRPEDLQLVAELVLD